MIGGMTLVYDYRIGGKMPLPGCGQNNPQVKRSEPVEKSRPYMRGCGGRF
jgi:hypothetical protein